MNKLTFMYEGNPKDVSFSKEPFNKTKNNKIRFDDALKKNRNSF